MGRVALWIGNLRWSLDRAACFEAILRGSKEKLLRDAVLALVLFLGAVGAELISTTFLSIGYFFFVVEGSAYILFAAHFYPACISWRECHTALSVSCLFLTSNQRFCTCETAILGQGSGGIGDDRVVKRKMPVSFIPNPMIYNCLLHLGEGWKWKTKNSWSACMRVREGTEKRPFFIGKQMVRLRNKEWNAACL